MKSTGAKKAAIKSPPLQLNFDDNRFLAALFGEHDRNLARIEKELDVEVSSRGNRILIAGNSWSQQAAKSALTNLYELLAQGHNLSDGEVTGAIRMAEASVTEHGLNMDTTPGGAGAGVSRLI